MIGGMIWENAGGRGTISLRQSVLDNTNPVGKLSIIFFFQAAHPLNTSLISVPDVSHIAIRSFLETPGNFFSHALHKHSTQSACIGVKWYSVPNHLTARKSGLCQLSSVAPPWSLTWPSLLAAIAAAAFRIASIASSRWRVKCTPSQEVVTMSLPEDQRASWQSRIRWQPQNQLAFGQNLDIVQLRAQTMPRPRW